MNKPPFEVFLVIFFLGLSVVLAILMIGFALYHRGYQDGQAAGVQSVLDSYTVSCKYGSVPGNSGECRLIL